MNNRSEPSEKETCSLHLQDRDGLSWVQLGHVCALGLVMACGPLSCAQDENKNFELSIERSVRVTTDSNANAEARCDPASQLNCSNFDLVLDDGTTLLQRDAFAECAITSEGDLRVEIRSSNTDDSNARALFRVHQNPSPEGTARCEGLKADRTSETGYQRSSCDVIIQFGPDIFAATPFERCTAIAEDDGALRGTISCSLLRTGQKKLIVNKLSYLCAPTHEGDTEEPAQERDGQ